MHGHKSSLVRPAEIKARVDNDTKHMQELASMVRKRLRHWLVSTRDTRSVPDESWIECGKWLTLTMRELHRWVADQPHEPDDKPLTTAEYEREIDEIFDERLRAMTPAERRDRIQRIEHEPGGPSTPASPDRWNS